MFNDVERIAYTGCYIVQHARSIHPVILPAMTTSRELAQAVVHAHAERLARIAALVRQGMTQKDIAALEGVSQPNIARLVAKAKKKGLL